MAYVALLDASVLHPWVVCDVLLRLAERGLFRPAWSDQILDEVVESLTERKPDHAERFQRRREHMEAAFAEAMTSRPERLASVFRMRSTRVTAMSSPRRSRLAPT